MFNKGDMEERAVSKRNTRPQTLAAYKNTIDFHSSRSLQLRK